MTTPTDTDRPRRPRRQWTIRMSQHLGVRLRLLQEWRNEPGFPDPDLPDQVADHAWADFEARVRAWVALRHPVVNHHKVRPVFPEPGALAPASPGPAGLTGIPRPGPDAAAAEHKAWADAERAHLALHRERVEHDQAVAKLVPRAVAVDLARAFKAEGLAACDSLLATLRERLTDADRVRLAPALAGDLAAIKQQLEAALKAAWLRTVPQESRP